MAGRRGPPAVFLPLGGHSRAGSRNARGPVRVERVFINGAQLPAEWYPRGQLPARSRGQMFTEIAERPFRPRAPRFIPHLRSEAAPCLGLAGLQALREERHPGDLRRGTGTHRVDLEGSKEARGLVPPWWGEPSQRGGGAGWEVGFEGWIGVFRTSRGGKNSTVPRLGGEQGAWCHPGCQEHGMQGRKGESFSGS